MYRTGQRQHVFLITDGPHELAVGVDGVKRVHLRHTEQLIDSATQGGWALRFCFMPGLLYSNVCDLKGNYEIQPQLAAPIPILVKAYCWGEESDHGNLHGVELFGEVKNVVRYEDKMPRDENPAPILYANDLVYISYHPEHGTGGLVILGNTRAIRSGKGVMRELDDAEPIINSLSQLQREYIGKTSTSRCRSVYKVAGTSQELPIKHGLPLSVNFKADS